VLAPLNREGDKAGIKLNDGSVTTRQAGPKPMPLDRSRLERGVRLRRMGGQGLPLVINAACTEIWSASNIAFGLCPLLTASAIEALEAHGQRGAEKNLSRKAGVGRMDRHHAID